MSEEVASGVDQGRSDECLTTPDSSLGESLSGHHPRVLIIEDDPEVAATIQRYLKRSGLPSEVAHSGGDAAARKAAFLPDVVLVDLELPDTRGETLVRWLAKQDDCGIIVVSGNGEDTDRILNLEIGADDYIVKPPNMRELVARIRSVHRRTHSPTPPKEVRNDEQHMIAVGRCLVNLRSRRVQDAMSRPVELTAAEFAVLEALIKADGSPVSRESLSEIALRRPWGANDRGVDQLIFGLRRKLAPPEEARWLIQSIRNAGYLLCLRADSDH
jgi:DNA-binding response OmpR family regulator